MCEISSQGFPSGRTPRLIQPIVLLLLSQKESYGYEIIQNIKNGDYMETCPDPGIIYRVLKKFEKDGAVVCDWMNPSKGPSKKVYRITEKGEVLLDNWAGAINMKIKTLNRIVSEYESLNNKRKEIKGGK